MRVTPDLDTLNTFYICNPAEDSFMETDPVITFTGENYLVVWSDEKYGPSNTFHPFAARVTPAGVVLDSGVRVSTSGGYEYRPNVADDGTRSLVVWSGSSNGSYGRFVNRDGLPEDDAFQIAPGTASGPNLCFGDSCYLVVWHEGAYPTLELYGNLVSRRGELIGDRIQIATGSGCNRWAALAYDGENFLTVWMSGLNNEPETIFGQFIANDGSLIGDRFPVSDTSGVIRWWPALAFSDSNCLVAWEQGSGYDVYGNVDVRVTGVAEPSPTPATQRSRRPSVLSGGLPNYVPLYDALGRRSQALKPGVYFTREAGQTSKVLRVRQSPTVCCRGSGTPRAAVLEHPFLHVWMRWGHESHAAAGCAAAMVDYREDYFLPFLTVFLTAFFAFFAGMYPPLVRIWPARGRASANTSRNGQLCVEEATGVSSK